MAGPRTGSFARVLRNPALRRIQLAFFGSTLGDWAYATAVTVWAYSVGGATAVGVFQAVRFVVVAFAGPVGALVADKVSRRHFMMATDAIRGVLVAAAAVTIGLDGPPAVVFGLAIVAVIVGASFRSAQAGLVPRLVDEPGELTAANAVTANLETVAMFAGPALGALLVGLVDVQVVFWLNAVSYAWSLALVAAVRVPPAPPAPTGPAVQTIPAVPLAPADADTGEQREGFVREVGAGFAQLARDRDLRAVALLGAYQGLLWGALTVFLVMVALSTLDTGAEGVGYLNSLMAIGTVVGGLIVLTRVRRGRLGQDMVVGVCGWAVPLVALALLLGPVTAVVALVVIGLADAWVNIGLETIPQRIAPDRVLSRVYAAVESSLIAAMALGSILAPVLVHLLGLRGAMGLLGAAVTVLAVTSYPRLRRLDERLAGPEHLGLLGRIGIFAPLAPPVLESLARRLRPESFRAGTTILAEGESSDRFYVIRAGHVDVTQGDRLLRVEGPGEFFGEVGLLHDLPRTATVAALEDVELLALERADFLAAVTGSQESSRAAEDVVAARLAV